MRAVARPGSSGAQRRDLAGRLHDECGGKHEWRLLLRSIEWMPVRQSRPAQWVSLASPHPIPGRANATSVLGRVDWDARGRTDVSVFSGPGNSTTLSLLFFFSSLLLFFSSSRRHLTPKAKEVLCRAVWCRGCVARGGTLERDALGAPTSHSTDRNRRHLPCPSRSPLSQAFRQVPPAATAPPTPGRPIQTLPPFFPLPHSYRTNIIFRVSENDSVFKR